MIRLKLNILLFKLHSCLCEINILKLELYRAVIMYTKLKTIYYLFKCIDFYFTSIIYSMVLFVAFTLTLRIYKSMRG